MWKQVTIEIKIATLGIKREKEGKKKNIYKTLTNPFVFP